jgi:hypothetical protein
VPTTIDLIDDLEDNNAEINPKSSPKRDGYWSTFNDGMKPDSGATPTQSPIPFLPTALSSVDGGADSGDMSDYAARTYGSGFVGWGAAMAFDLNATATTKSTYNASGYTGFTFLAKVGSGSTKSVYVRFVDKNTLDIGGVCVKSPVNGCDAYFQKKVTLTTSWTRYYVPFCDQDLTQPTYANPPEDAVDSAALYSIQFQIAPNVSFDVWVDDPGFYKLP